MSMSKQFRNIIGKAFSIVPDKKYLEFRYFLTFHKILNLNMPVTYNEKLQWMKLYDRNPLYTKLVDKYEVKKILEKKYKGNIQLVPTLGVWNSFDEIDFDKLPQKFVLKCTHDSGSILICKDKKTFDYNTARKHFNKCIKHSGYIGGREWAYKNVKPRILAEELLQEPNNEGIKDYKFFCFNGKVKALFIATDRGIKGKDVKFDFFDENFCHLPLKHGHENAIITPKKPSNFESMKSEAEILSKGLRHVRIDFYDINNKIYFGEFTFYHHSGFVPFDPEIWDEKFGAWLDLE